MTSQPLQDIYQIKKMIDRSSRFRAISGIAGIITGIVALLTLFIYFNIARGAAFSELVSFDKIIFSNQINSIVWLAGLCFVAAFSTSFYFIWKRSKRLGVSIFSSVSKRVFINIAIPMFVGGLLLVKISLLHYYELAMPICLLFYGIGLLGAARSTYNEVYYLAGSFLLIGCISLFLPQYNFLFWAIGFGILHIIFGTFLWNRYERN